MEHYAHYKALKLDRRGRTLVITLDNPPMNSVSGPMHEELARIFVDINNDPRTSVVVITGAGQKAFSAGGDIHRMVERIEQGLHAEWLEGIRQAKEIIYGILRLERPLIARVNGHAMGLGSSLATLADFSYMLDNGKIADTHVKIGLAAGDGGALLWPLLIGYNRARKYLLTGGVLSASEAVEAGLITGHVDSTAELDREVFDLADRLSAGATRAINATKMAINLVLRRQIEGLVEAHLGLETYTYLSKDHYEAAKAFRDKRDPSFTGE